MDSRISDIFDHFIKFEGNSPYFYLDGAGKVTIGIGCVIPNAEAACALSFFHYSSNLLASVDEIVKEYKYFSTMKSDMGLLFYKRMATLYLLPMAIERLFEFRIHDILSQLNKSFPDFVMLPTNVAAVVLDMAFNLGVTGLLTKFPKFMDAIKDENYVIAAKESERKGISAARNQWARETLLSTEL